VVYLGSPVVGECIIALLSFSLPSNSNIAF